MKENTNNYFDPSEYIRNFQQLLASDKKKIGFLFGAGTSLVINPKTRDPYVPAIGKMTSTIEAELFKTEKYQTAITEIKKEIEEDGKTYTIETLLTKLELKRQVVGLGSLNSLTKDDFENLIKTIKNEIHKIVSVENDIVQNIKANNFLHSMFAEWIGKADRKNGIEIFTTNYDYLFEIALEDKSVPYYDGFSGSYKPFFDGESVNDMSFLPKQTKLWKIHGSLGWYWDEDYNRIVRETASSSDNDIMIFPSTLKYDQSRKQPYTALGDRLTNFIKQDDSILIICGYSFGDEHINERIISALDSNQLNHVYVLLYDKYCENEVKKFSFTSDSDVAKIAVEHSKISVFASRAAVIGGVYGQWKLKREPDKDDSLRIDLYFDEDACANDEDEIGKPIKQNWIGGGELTLPDFSKFVGFLQNMIFDNITE